MTAGSPPRILDGIRVVELSHVLACPHCGRHLADLGAEVIKVESPGRGRLHAPPRWRPRAARTAREAAHAHPHSVDRGTSEVVDDPEHRPRRVFRSAMRFSATPPRPQGPSPARVGAHARAVLGRVLGYEPARIDRLITLGAVQQASRGAFAGLDPGGPTALR